MGMGMGMGTECGWADGDGRACGVSRLAMYERRVMVGLVLGLLWWLAVWIG